MEGYTKSPCNSDGKDNPSMLNHIWKDLKVTSWHRSNFSLTQPVKSILKEERGCTDEMKHKEGDGETEKKDSFCVCLASCLKDKRRLSIFQFSLVQSLSHVWLFATLWIAGRQASLSITNSHSSLRLTSMESVMPSSHLILCRTLFLLPPIPPSISLFQWVNSSHEVAKVLEFQL